MFDQEYNAYDGYKNYVTYAVVMELTSDEKRKYIRACLKLMKDSGVKITMQNLYGLLVKNFFETVKMTTKSGISYMDKDIDRLNTSIALYNWYYDVVC